MIDGLFSSWKPTENVPKEAKMLDLGTNSPETNTTRKQNITGGKHHDHNVYQ